MTKRQPPRPETQNPDPAEQEFLAHSKAALDAQLEQVDGATQTRLRAIRREAVHLAQRKSSEIGIPWAKGIAVTCAVSLAVVLVVQQSRVGSKGAGPEPLLEIAFDDMGLLSDKQAMEFYQDLEFYQWLEEQEQAQPPQDQV